MCRGLGAASTVGCNNSVTLVTAISVTQFHTALANSAHKARNAYLWEGSDEQSIQQR